MINHPKTKAEAVKYWVGRCIYSEKRCAFSVPEGGRSASFRQCERKPGFGPAELYCKRHAQEFEDKKEVATWYRVSKYTHEVEAVPIVGFTETRVDLGRYTEKRSNDWHVWFSTLDEVEVYLRERLVSIRKRYEYDKNELETALEKLK